MSEVELSPIEGYVLMSLVAKRDIWVNWPKDAPHGPVVVANGLAEKGFITLDIGGTIRGVTSTGYAAAEEYARSESVSEPTDQVSKAHDALGTMGSEKNFIARQALEWGRLALLFGYNELVKQAASLGERVAMRYMRKELEVSLEKDPVPGVELKVTHEGTIICTLTRHMPAIELFESDIELMRKAVAEFDERKRREEGALGGNRAAH